MRFLMHYCIYEIIRIKYDYAIIHFDLFKDLFISFVLLCEIVKNGNDLTGVWT